MTRSILFSLTAVLLTGCLSAGGGAPEAVMIQDDRIVVRMSNGWPCVGFQDQGQQTENGWSGRLDGCPAPYPYKVTFRDGTNPARVVLTEVFGALGGENLLSPRAVVEITGAKGEVWAFVSPKSES